MGTEPSPTQSRGKSRREADLRRKRPCHAALVDSGQREPHRQHGRVRGPPPRPVPAGSGLCQQAVACVRSPCCTRTPHLCFGEVSPRAHPGTSTSAAFSAAEAGPLLFPDKNPDTDTGRGPLPLCAQGVPGPLRTRSLLGSLAGIDPPREPPGAARPHHVGVTTAVRLAAGFVAPHAPRSSAQPTSLPRGTALGVRRVFQAEAKGKLCWPPDTESRRAAVPSSMGSFPRALPPGSAGGTVV